MSSYYGGGWATYEVEAETFGGTGGFEEQPEVLRNNLRRTRFGLRVDQHGGAHRRLRGYELEKVDGMPSNLS